MANLSEDVYFVACSASLHRNHDLYSLAAVNILLSITASLGNILILIALSKESSLHPPSKLLYRCLTVTDLCVGLLSHPLFVIQLLPMAYPEGVQFCYTFVKVSINDLLGRIFSGVSLCTLTAISVDRLLALLLGLRYKQTVTLRRTQYTVVGIWILNISVPFLWRFWSHKITQGVISAIICITLLSSAFCYMKIYLSLRHQRHARVHQRQPNGDEILYLLKIKRYRKTVSTALWVQLTLVACYLPYGITSAVIDPFSPSDLLPKRITITIVYFNSSLNPILYCWKIRGIRKAVKGTVRRMCCAICPGRRASYNLRQLSVKGSS